MIKVKNLSKTYQNGYQALTNVSFEIQPGEFVYCVGPSGSGKSTLFKALSREIEFSFGSVELNQFRVEKIPARKLYQLRREIGIVGQDDLLLEQTTCFENVAFSLRALGINQKEIKERARAALEQVGMLAYQKHYPAELSIGQRKKITIARALVNQPSIILADEPTANLDNKSSVDIMKLFLKIHQKGTTILLATHDSTMVNSIRKRVIELKEGNLIRDDHLGGYSSFFDPKDVYVW
ncbi:cell division ATP-binding protein FtsE [Enterococcus lemanii]|uniref:Cell division ATP-binding protein FtsE n=1 Tax=Enterococcus lemanii TaxID=1159752 RepID=A0ABV9MWE3_9ENTE|nr:ATP-binding cassette domain-containing protein [Enterococcus lemanii]MBM7708075.1 cell division transport system ATP-binding protein [Enterococcus lemanii]